MRSKFLYRLQLNTGKTEFLWSTTSRRLHQLPQLSLWVGSDHIVPASVVRDLGIYIDSDVSMRSLVAKTVSTCHAILRQLRTIRSAVAGVVSRPLAAGLRQCDTGRRFITSLVTATVSDEHRCSDYFSSSKFQHITPLLRQLHWLKAPERIPFKYTVLVYKCLHESTPAYLIDELCQVAECRENRIDLPRGTASTADHPSVSV